MPQTNIATPELEIGWSFCTLNVFVLTTGAFLMFSAISMKKEPAVVLDMSRLSYTMYLMHIFWLGLWVGIFKFDMQLPTGLAIPAIAVCTFLSSWLTARIIAFIPGARWLGIDEPKRPAEAASRRLA